MNDSVEAPAESRFADQKIVVVAGTGGVGKTTLSAVLALAQARAGRRVLVLTIDPARRLAQALGITPSAGDAQRVELPPGFAGSLHAAMLDARLTFDHVVRRYAPNPDIARRILANPFYQRAAGALGGSQEYMAMEALLEAREGGEWDLVILDTPPSQNAVEFLDAPGRMLSVLERGNLGWLITPAFDAARAGTRLFGKGGAAMFRVFERLTGGNVLQGISEFVTAFADLLPGFKDRAGRVRAILTGQDSSFVLVTTARDDLHGPTQRFAEALQEHGHRLTLVMVNRCSPPVPNRGKLGAQSELRQRLGGLSAVEVARLHKVLRESQARRWRRYTMEQAAIDSLRDRISPLPLACIEEIPTPPHSIEELLELLRRLPKETTR
jgi:anion-transporting  ArsA/GET3 family ATPase